MGCRENKGGTGGYRRGADGAVGREEGQKRKEGRETGPSVMEGPGVRDGGTGKMGTDGWRGAQEVIGGMGRRSHWTDGWGPLPTLAAPTRGRGVHL